MPPDGGYYTDSTQPGNREHSMDPKRAGLFDRVRFLESRLDRLEVMLLAQDATIREQCRQIGLLAASGNVDGHRKAMVRIAAEVATDYGLTLAEMKGETRAEGVSHPRQYAMLLMRQAGYSAPEIGRFFGKDHTTVLRGARAARMRGEA